MIDIMGLKCVLDMGFSMRIRIVRLSVVVRLFFSSWRLMLFGERCCVVMLEFIMIVMSRLVLRNLVVVWCSR